MLKEHNFVSLKGNLAEFPMPESEYSRPELQAYFVHYGFEANLEFGHAFYMGSSVYHGRSIARCQWHKPSARGTVCLVHGLFDHVGLYLRLIHALLKADYNVLAFDLPGHGLSSGDYGDIHGFSDYSDVFTSLIQDVFREETQYPELCIETQKGLLVVGQSTGAAVLLRELCCVHSPLPLAITRAVFLAPLIYPKQYTSVKALYYLLRPFIRSLPRRFQINSHDAEFCSFLEGNDPLQPKRMVVSWVKAMLDWVSEFKRFCLVKGEGAVIVPCLLIQGTQDGTVEGRKNVPLIESVFRECEVEWVEGAMHHLVCEGDVWREQSVNALLKFLKQDD